MWYVKAAEHGDERAIARLKVIREAETGNGTDGKKGKLKKDAKAAKAGDKNSPHEGGDKGDCRIM